MAGLRAFLAARRHRRDRIDHALLRLEAGAVAAERQAERLAEAVAVSHRALALLGDRLVALADQPARVDRLIDHARAEITGAAREIATRAAERVAEEIAPARAAAELHADVMRASLDRLRGETEALTGAQAAASAVAALAGTTQAALSETLSALARRSDGAAGTAERAAERIKAAAARLDLPAPARRRTSRAD